MKRHMKTVNLDGSPYEKNRQVIRDLQVTPFAYSLRGEPRSMCRT